jgi:hypothetical protein
VLAIGGRPVAGDRLLVAGDFLGAGDCLGTFVEGDCLGIGDCLVTGG